MSQVQNHYQTIKMMTVSSCSSMGTAKLALTLDIIRYGMYLEGHHGGISTIQVVNKYGRCCIYLPGALDLLVQVIANIVHSEPFDWAWQVL